MTIKTIRSRRVLIKQFFITPMAIIFFPGCDFIGKPDTKTISKHLIEPLRHHKVAVSLGQQVVNSDTILKALSLKQLTQTIINKIGLKNKQISRSTLNEFSKLLQLAIRQDFADEKIIKINGWLLSETEAQLCGLLYRYKNSEI